MPSVLIVDDLLSIHEMLDAVIQPTGFSTSFATNGEKALARYKAEKFDLVLADIDMKPMDGITLLKQLKAYDPSCVLIIMTAYASTESAIQALKHGAFDYLQKPFRVDELISTLKRGIEFRKAQSERVADPAGGGIKMTEIEGRLLGNSTVMKKLIQQVRKLTTVRTPVLLHGEEGTGKSTIAEVLHANSCPSDAPFVRLDCSLSNETDLRAGLLGATGTGGTHTEKAKGGTLYLEHIDRLPMGVQKQFVSVLRSTNNSFRLICSSTEDLEALIDEGRFNDELFYRVASIPVQLPPLRERSDDIPTLIRYFVSRASNSNFDANLVEFTPEALEVLSSYRWPGNLTELSQVIIQIASTTDVRVVGPATLPSRIKELNLWQPLPEFLRVQEAKYIASVLRACGGDKAKASKILGVEASKL